MDQIKISKRNNKAQIMLVSFFIIGFFILGFLSGGSEKLT